MRPRASFARLGALALVAGLMLGGTACGLVAGLDKLTFQDPASCAAPCDDLDPCTESDCLVDGACHGTPVADGPEATDPIGNCQTMACVGGVAKITADDGDVPDDDGNSCTEEACAEGTPSHAAKPDGDPCAIGADPAAGVCVAGKCAAKCTQDLGCDDHNACTADACDLAESLCKFTPLDDGTQTPGAVSMPGDCHTHRCIGGVDVNAIDDVDLVQPPSDCVTASCLNGELLLPPKALGTACATSGGQVCDGAGACVACNVTADCAPTGDDCVIAVCNADKTCGTVNAAAGVQVSFALQTKGNCQTIYCDGMGSSGPMINNTDVPDDGNPCTVESCVAGVPMSAPGPSGVDCGVGQKCNAAGKCGCADSTQCVAPDTCGGGNPGTTFTCGCTKTTCAALGATCGQPSDGCYATLMCNNGVKNGAETDVDCGGGGGCATPCTMGKVCKVDTDCGSGHCADGVCCTSTCAGACMACNLAGSLGTCTPIAAGASDPFTCVAPSTCDGAGSCKKPLGAVCIANAQCASTNCVDGVCCSTNCNGTCMTCNNAGSLGTCSPILSGKTDTNATTTCVAPNACNGTGACKKTNGQTCVLGGECVSGSCADGYCCNTACTGTCTACNIGASTGTCSNIVAGQTDTNPANACAGTSVCDGAGACMLGTGQPCTLGSQCISNFCTGGFCL
jgi:slime mold repeat-containing protein